MALNKALLTLLIFLSFSFAEEQKFWTRKKEPMRSTGRDVGDPLYLTPLIQAGQIDEAQKQARVTDVLPGLEAEPDLQPESYSGFITVKPETNGNIFFWFFPAQENTLNAPVTIWLQGGPGSSSMFGLFEINGPISAQYEVEGDESSPVIGRLNPHSWHSVSNMIYVDQPVGTGFSHTDASGLVKNQDEVAEDMHNFLIQWFTMFPEYQKNEFYVFGESYAGKYNPAIARKIHDENILSNFRINLAGIGIGNGLMDPENTAVYADLLYRIGLINEVAHKEMLEIEDIIQNFVMEGDFDKARDVHEAELTYAIRHTQCGNLYDFTQCEAAAEESNYETLANADQTRQAVHAGSVEFVPHSGGVSEALRGDIFVSQKENIEFLLEHYPFLIYNGNQDLICHHFGILNMFQSMTTWSLAAEYQETQGQAFKVDPGQNNNVDVGGHLKAVGNLRLMSVRNAGHMAPRYQPVVTLEIFRRFIGGQL